MFDVQHVRVLLSFNSKFDWILRKLTCRTNGCQSHFFRGLTFDATVCLFHGGLAVFDRDNVGQGNHEYFAVPQPKRDKLVTRLVESQNGSFNRGGGGSVRVPVSQFAFRIYYNGELPHIPFTFLCSLVKQENICPELRNKTCERVLNFTPYRMVCGRYGNIIPDTSE
jgi:hypothetical protein